jgi:hypothetical protein
VNSLEEIDLFLKLLPNYLDTSIQLVHKDKLMVNKDKLV